MLDITASSANLFSLPFELRSRIYVLALHDNPIPVDDDIYSPRGALIPNLSLLSTNRQIYAEARGIPLQIHGLGREYIPDKPMLDFLQPFQISHLTKLTITYIYPTYLTAFTSYPNNHLLGLQDLNLDLLRIYADNWLVKAKTFDWRKTANRDDVCHDLPKSSRWLQAICAMKGWKQLDVDFKEMEMEELVWKKGPFVQALFDDFRSFVNAGMLDGTAGDTNPAFTIWHKQDDMPFNEKITVLRTVGLRAHGEPEWLMKDLGTLVRGEECVLDAQRREREEGKGGDVEWEREREWPDFHVGERLGAVRWRKGWCARCDPRLKA